MIFEWIDWAIETPAFWVGAGIGVARLLFR